VDVICITQENIFSLPFTPKNIFMLNYRLKGKGTKQIIFVHGNSQSLELWDDVIDSEDLQSEFLLIAVDLPGHGKSFKSKQPEKDYSIQGMAGYLKEFILQYSNSKYIIVANSAGTVLMGEIVHLLFNCKGIFLTGANIIGENITPADILQPNPNLTPFFISSPTDEDLNRWIDEGSCNLSNDIKERIKEVYRQTDPCFREQWFASISRQEWTDELENLNTLAAPVAIVYGQADKFTHIHYLDKSALKKWKNKIIAIPEAGHLLQYDKPKILAQLIKEFAEDCFK
jgi:pimeloyl-ACP methyl ester carboxylesterase